jgi:RNA polymerase sigma-70 factor (ECF subfamily)
VAASRSIVRKTSKGTSELWKNYKREQALSGHPRSRVEVQNQAMSEEEKNTQSGGQPQEGASGSLEVPAEGEAVEQGLPAEFARNEEVKTLVTAAQDGDEGALNELFTRYYHVLVQTAQRRLGPRLKAKETPDDLAQTTFREATRDFKAYRYRGEGSLLRWLIQILQNKIRDRAEFYSAGKRDLSRERSLDPTPSADGEKQKSIDPMSADLTVTMRVERVENFGILRDAMSELSEDHRRAITLVFFQGLSLREAGQRMGGRSEDAVRMMLRRAEGRLGDLLKRTLGPEAE